MDGCVVAGVLALVLGVVVAGPFVCVAVHVAWDGLGVVLEEITKVLPGVDRKPNGRVI
jgi:hypothetical protein